MTVGPVQLDAINALRQLDLERDLEYRLWAPVGAKWEPREEVIIGLSNSAGELIDEHYLPKWFMLQ